MALYSIWLISKGPTVCSVLREVGRVLISGCGNNKTPTTNTAYTMFCVSSHYFSTALHSTHLPALLDMEFLLKSSSHTTAVFVYLSYSTGMRFCVHEKHFNACCFLMCQPPLLVLCTPLSNWIWTSRHPLDNLKSLIITQIYFEVFTDIIFASGALFSFSCDPITLSPLTGA